MLRSRVLRIRIENSGACSPALPTSIDRALQSLVTSANAGRIDEASLAALPAPDKVDSNETDIVEHDGCIVVADGADVFPLIIDGLRRRLEHRIESDERLVLVGERP